MQIHFISMTLLVICAPFAFSDEVPGKTINPCMKPIKGGTFAMGSTEGKSDEQPIHTVTISDFYMDSTEVTQKEFTDLAGKYISDTLRRPFKLFGLLETVGKGDNYPMYNICWYDMVVYCNARSRKEGYDTVYTYDSISDTIGLNGQLHGVKINYSKIGYRLPTEAEWEYACRGSAVETYYWGAESLAVNYGWFADNSDRMVYPVAQKSSNSLGLYDMCGNVFDFCNDWYAPYDSGPQIDPHGPDTGSLKIGRGGSMTYGVADMRISRRLEFMPNIRYLYYGFRCVLSAASIPIGVKNAPPHRSFSIHGKRSWFLISPASSGLSFPKGTNSLSVYALNGRKVLEVEKDKAPHLLRRASKNLRKGAFVVVEEP